MHKPTLLVVDDEADLLAELKPFLERSGFTVATAANGRHALETLQSLTPDLIILDVLMPHMDGRELLRRLRQANNWTPVILLTQVGTPVERAMSLQEGADDYLNKPFDPLELVARITAVLRRTQMGKDPLSSFRYLQSGELRIDRQLRQAKLNEALIPLTARAFAVLEHMMLNPGEIVTRQRLLDEVWGWEHAVETRAVDIRISEIRKSLSDYDPNCIETVTGTGYRFNPQVAGHA